MTNIQYVLSEEINQAINLIMAGYLKETRAHCVLLLSKSGHLINQAGFTNTFNLQSIAALIGGIFTSTQALAKVVSEEKFKVMFQEGEKWNVYFCLTADQFILATIFDKSTVVGMIRHAAAEADREMAPHLVKAIVLDADQASRDFSEKMNLPVDISATSSAAREEALPDFNRAVEDALSKLFS